MLYIVERLRKDNLQSLVHSLPFIFKWLSQASVPIPSGAINQRAGVRILRESALWQSKIPAVIQPVKCLIVQRWRAGARSILLGGSVDG